MSLSVRVRNRLMDAINMGFDAIGVEANTRMPRTKDTRPSNKGPIAWEYFIASFLAARADARLKIARKAAVESGIIFDHEKNPREPGTNEPVYMGDQVAVWLTVNKPTRVVKADVFAELLIKKGVDQKLVTQCMEDATATTRPPHIFKVSLIAGQEQAAAE